MLSKYLYNFRLGNLFFLIMRSDSKRRELFFIVITPIIKNLINNSVIYI